MSFFKKIQERIIPIQPIHPVHSMKPATHIKHEFVDFSSAYRIGITCYFQDIASQEIINTYKSSLEKLGYECDVLLFVDKKERDNTVYLQSFNWDDLDKKTMLPHSPRTDRFIVKRYDLLLNLFLHDCPPLLYLSYMSHARCRVSLFTDYFKECTDLLIPNEEGMNVETLIQRMNKTLKIKPYERKQI